MTPKEAKRHLDGVLDELASKQRELTAARIALADALDDDYDYSKTLAGNIQKLGDICGEAISERDAYKRRSDALYKKLVKEAENKQLRADAEAAKTAPLTFEIRRLS